MLQSWYQRWGAERDSRAQSGAASCCLCPRLHEQLALSVWARVLSHQWCGLMLTLVSLSVPLPLGGCWGGARWQSGTQAGWTPVSVAPPGCFSGFFGRQGISAVPSAQARWLGSQAFLGVELGVGLVPAWAPASFWPGGWG